jgi:peroxiredoxin
MLQAGQKAPDFKLNDTNKNEVSLSDFKGKNLIIFFFPMAWTGSCTKEMCSVQEDYKAYDKLNTAVVGISVDSHFALKRFAEDNKIEYPLLSDFNRQAIKAYDVVHHDFAFGYKDVARRATFVIDENGIIRYAHAMENIGEVPDMNAIKEALTQLA